MKSVVWILATGLLVAAVTVIYIAMTGERISPVEPNLEVAGETSVLSDDYAEPTPAPDFALPTLDAGEFRMAEQRVKVVLFNFWASLCAPCRFEIPELIELQSGYGTD